MSVNRIVFLSICGMGLVLAPLIIDGLYGGYIANRMASEASVLSDKEQVLSHFGETSNKGVWLAEKNKGWSEYWHYNNPSMTARIFDKRAGIYIFFSENGIITSVEKKMLFKDSLVVCK